MCPILYVRAAINVRILLSPLWEAREEFLSEWSATRNLSWTRGQVPVSSIKVEVKKKHISFGWTFSCFAARLIERDLSVRTAPCARLRGTVAPWVGFSLTAVSIAYWQRSLAVPKPAKQNVVNLETIVLSGTRGP
jgi:hypothetical protein